MVMQPRFSAAFLTDLDFVYSNTGDGNLLAAFLRDVEVAHAYALAVLPQPSDISVADLNSLAKVLKAWRGDRQRLLRQYLEVHPDDPLLSSVSLFQTMDYGRLETAHTRGLPSRR